LTELDASAIVLDLGGGKPVMLALPVYRAMSCAAGAHTRVVAFSVRETTQVTPPKPRLLDRVREAIRARHYSRRTEKTYVAWIRRYILFHGKRHPAEMGAAEVTRFLTSLAVDGNVAASTQNQALSALLFLYREVLEQDLPWLDNVVRAKGAQRLPVVLTRADVRAVIQELQGTPRLMALLMYGAGLRLLECARLRVQDVDFGSNQIVVRGGKGDKDRVTMLPATGKADCHGPWRASTRTRGGSGLGSGCFRRLGSTWIASPASTAGTTCTSPCCNAR